MVTARAAMPRPPTTYCESPKGWTAVECEGGGYWHVPRRCRHCDGCLLARTRRTIAEIGSGVRRDDWACFMTLTSLPSTEWPVLMRRFQSLVKSIRERYGHVEYAAVKEEGSKTGMKHLHVVMTGVVWIPWQWLSKAWEKRTGAWNVDIQRMATGPERVLRYVAKYVTKALGDGGGKRVTYSKGFREPFGVDGPHQTAVVPWRLAPTIPAKAAVKRPDGSYVARWCEVCLGPKPVPKGGQIGVSFAREGGESERAIL